MSNNSKKILKITVILLLFISLILGTLTIYFFREYFFKEVEELSIDIQTKPITQVLGIKSSLSEYRNLNLIEVKPDISHDLLALNQRSYILASEELEDSTVTSEIKKTPGFLGIGFYFKNLKDYLSKGEPIGAVINGVVKNSPAFSSGLKVGDIIVAIDGNEFSDEQELTKFIQSKFSGEKVKIKLYSDKKLKDIEVILGEKN